MPRSQGGRFSFPPREGQPSRRLACAGVLAALGALARWSTSNASTTARVPCRFVGGERHCDESKAVPCSHRQAYVVADHGIHTGGPVALRQLAKSFNDAFPGQGFMSEIKHPMPEGIAGAFEPRKLCPGDIYIVPEVTHCDGQPPNGVRMYV